MKALKIIIAALVGWTIVGCGSGDVSNADSNKTSAEIKKGNADLGKDQKLPPGDGPGN